MPSPAFIPLNLAVLTVSDTRTAATDTSGAYLVNALQAAGHRLAQHQRVEDCRYRIRAFVSQCIAEPSIQGVLITGGTGFAARDVTPEAVMPLLDKIIEGFGEAFRAISLQEIGSSSLQSRALAGLANRTFIACLPGSTGACTTAWTHLLAAQLDNRTRPCNFYPHLGLPPHA